MYRRILIAIYVLVPCLIVLAVLACGKHAPNDALGPTIITLGPTAAVATPAPAPIPTPTPLPSPVYTFAPDPARPLPDEGERVALGKSRGLGGVISSNLPLVSVTALLLCDYSEDARYPYERTVTFDPAAGVTEYSLVSADTLEGESLDSLVKFSELTAGHHQLMLLARAAGEAAARPVVTLHFDVLSEDWNRIRPDQFSNNSFPSALAFFSGQEDRFLYRYQWVHERYIIADPDWEKANIIEVPVDEGEPWLVHALAAPYYEKVRQYLFSANFRVHGTNGDTGVLPLTRCIESYSGSYCSRFTSSKKNISHHAFGTASDVNATLAPNENTRDNLALIETEVKQHLAYNGILTENGVSYYDFTYTGSYPATGAGVPETVLNYLLYELAFYRAGFDWGHYYNSTSDGMHFTLTDNLAGRHDSGDRALRKVFAYYD